ncbi:MAG: adenosylmethionine--8-amino-7-oxononanoate transaminase [Actinomycetota bacterium]
MSETTVRWARHCPHCGAARPAAGPGCDCRAELDPPRHCPRCGRRLVVQVLPAGWTARCSAHGPLPGPSRVARLLAADRAHVWHPYAARRPAPPVRLVESAAGVRLRLVDDDDVAVDVVDGMSSWWCAIHGYRHPALDAALHAQADRMSHVMFGGLTHEPAVTLVERLVGLTPDPLQHVFLADSGSVSVEVAVKMALQYQAARGRPERHRLLTVRGGYHGDTFAAMSVCDPVDGMHRLFTGLLPAQVFAPRPPAGFHRDGADPAVLAWAAEVAALADRYAGELAAVVVEPVLQGAGGMHVYSPACLRVLREVADRHGLLLVLDEIATGFGRTGALFAADHAGVVADILCLGKALTGGYLSLAATLCTTEVATAVSAGPAGALLHGPTFMGNPLACAVAVANLDLLAGGAWPGQVARIEALLHEGLAGCAGRPGVRDVRVLGAVGVVQAESPVDVTAVTAAALRRGVWLRPFRDLVYTMPPYVCTDDDVRAITAAIRGAVDEALR